MRIFALVGKSGTGKSFQCMEVARRNNIEAVIDDGLLISRGKILAGSSAKHESNKLSSVKRAIFSFSDHAQSVKTAISKNNIESILILGTSDRMVNEIAQKLDLPEIEKTIYIDEISSPEEIQLAGEMRNKYGKHIIPAPVFEVKKQFAGYLLSAFLTQGKRDKVLEKTVIRPTYSYLGELKISPKVFADLCRFEALRIENVLEVGKIKSTADQNGCIQINIDLYLSLPCKIQKICKKVQSRVIKSIEDSTSLTVSEANIFVKQYKNP